MGVNYVFLITRVKGQIIANNLGIISPNLSTSIGFLKHVTETSVKTWGTTLA